MDSRLAPHGVTIPAGAYELGGRRYDSHTPGFADAIAEAHATHQRPRCLCLSGGIEMYVARLAGPSAGYIVKRMPNTGSHHAPDCPSYEPPPEASGLGQVLGAAIVEDPATGETTLKLDFPLTKIAGRSTMPSPCGESDSAKSSGTKLSLRALLHYLWDQAELTRWHPGFAGKRTWATVRKHLLQAAEHKIARGEALRGRLYIPEVFSVEQRDEINARRIAQWSHAVATPGKPQHLMLLIGEVKEIVPARYGFKAVIKHMPDQAFAIDEQLYRRLGRRFESELALWGTTDRLHMIMIATFGVAANGLPTIGELSLMPVAQEWLPVEDGFDQQLVAKLVAEKRSFIKCLRFIQARSAPMPRALLMDTAEGVQQLRITVQGRDEPQLDAAHVATATMAGRHSWTWEPSSSSMPKLPPQIARAFADRCAPLATAIGRGGDHCRIRLRSGCTGSDRERSVSTDRHYSASLASLGRPSAGID